MLKGINLYSGEGFADLGLHRAGWDTQAFCEIAPDKQRQLTLRFGRKPIFASDTAVTTKEKLNALGITRFDFVWGSPSVLLELKKQNKITATAGRKCLESLKISCPLGLLSKMLLASPVWASPVRKLTWKILATECNHILFQLLPSEHNIDGIESTSLPTLTVRDAIKKPMPKRNVTTKESGKVTGGQQEPLISVIGGAINPEWAELFMGAPINWTKREPSELSPWVIV